MTDAVSKLIPALEQSEVLVALFDAQDVLQYANPAYRRLFLRDLTLPVPFADILRHGFHNGFGVRIDCGDVEQFLEQILPRRRSRRTRCVVTDTVDDRWVSFTETLIDDGWLLTVATDITELKRHEHRISQLHASAVKASITDPLTGVANRRRILEVAQAQLDAYRLQHTLMSVVLIDIDNFKRINDAYGHAAGDKVLVEFCSRCRSLLRLSDTLGRVGGEEFLLVLPSVAADEAGQVMERLRDGIRGMGPVSFTFSGGIAQALSGESLDSLLHRADAALYSAKRSGRDRWVVGVPGVEVPSDDPSEPAAERAGAHGWVGGGAGAGD